MMMPTRNRKFADSSLEEDGFEPSVPRHNSFVSRPRRTSPVAMILCVGSSDQAGKQSWIDPFEPVAVQIIAQFGDEATIFRLAA